MARHKGRSAIEEANQVMQILPWQQPWITCRAIVFPCGVSVAILSIRRGFGARNAVIWKEDMQGAHDSVLEFRV